MFIQFLFLQKKDVAVKELKKSADDKSREDFINEAINMLELTKIQNENIITLIGICIGTENNYRKAPRK
jgi:hypothetical protein